LRPAEANAEQIGYWNSDEARHWVEHQDRYDRMLAQYADRLLAAAAIGSDERVLDVGCGTGTTTLRAAAAASAGDTLGLDVSESMIEQARRRAAGDGVANARFEVADAQTCTLSPGGRDVLISRFGVMFFDDPTAAFANLGAAMRTDGRLAFMCWQGLPQNEWMLVPGQALATVVSRPLAGPPGAPGPFAFGDPDHVRGILEGAGYRAVDFEPVTDAVLLAGGANLDDTMEFLGGTRMARVLFADAPPETEARALDAVRAALAPHQGPDGIRLGAAAWLVRAHR
jgi:SAM-dependent methyltransferase